jgi:phospho-acceptor domain-containing protein/GAF domain-containing protein
MTLGTQESEDTGLEVIDILSDPQYANRKPNARDISLQMAGLERLAHAFVENPETILQELVNAAVDLCGADSAGISIEKPDRSDEQFYHWVATAGFYSGFLNAILPRYPSACGICLERGRPQLFRVSRRFFEILGVDAPLVTDGILLPWQVDGTRGTIFVMAHGRAEAFDHGDIRTMQMLSDFAAAGFRQQRQNKRLIEQERAAAAAAMANDLAHKINNPLQSITNVVYLAANHKTDPAVKALAADLETELRQLSDLVNEILALPLASHKSNPPE